MKRDGHYILTVADWTAICKYFELNPRSVFIKDRLNLTFTEIQAYDIYTKAHLFSFYDHDGLIRIPNETSKDTYITIDISTVLIQKNRLPDNIKQLLKKRTTRTSSVKEANDIFQKRKV